MMMMMMILMMMVTEEWAISGFDDGYQVCSAHSQTGKTGKSAKGIMLMRNYSEMKNFHTIKRSIPSQRVEES